MQFFEHQERARLRTRALLALFVLAVAAVVAAVDALVVGLLFIGQVEFRPLLPEAEPLTALNLPLLIGTSVLTLALIGAAALWRARRLRSGGAQVVRELGGVPVAPDPSDPRQRRLRNLVEEMALAAGAPVPDVFILEDEPGINALAAGYSPADAVVAVTSGALDKLDRDQLQGVIAHEFSHIVHGDTRIDIRLMAALFGILAIALLGRRLRGTGAGLDGPRRPGALLLIGWLLNLIGSLGLFAARLIKAALARQREYLADAAAVQFTRNPDGIAGALRRIAVEPAGALLSVDTEEVSHMTFSAGTHARWLSAHPPLEERIRRIDPRFHPAQLVALARRIRQTEASTRRTAISDPAQGIAAGTQAPTEAPLGALLDPILDPAAVLATIGNPGQAELIAAALLTAGLPEGLRAVAHRPQWAQALLCLLLLDQDPKTRETQRLLVARRLGHETEQQIGHLIDAHPAPHPRQRLPLAELTIPALKQLPGADLARLDRTIAALIAADRQLSVFEYALGRLLRVRIRDALHPPRTQGRRKLAELAEPAQDLIRALAWIGHREQAARQAAEAAGLAQAGWTPSRGPTLREDWHEALDRTLTPLDALRPSAKATLVAALVATITHDHRVTVAEAEALRAICATLHVPLPLATSVGHRTQST